MTPLPAPAWHLFRAAFAVASVLLVAAFVAAAEPVRKSYDLPADTAEQSVKRLSEQSGVDVLLSTTLARDVRTQAVKGDFTAREALDRMFRGTGLVGAEDQRTGALTLVRESDAEKNGQRAAPTARKSDRPEDDQDRTVELSPFEVNTRRDEGYRAATTIAGSRINEEIKNIPASVSVMTSEFLQDIGATDLQQASEYMIGGGYAPSAWIDFRGFNFRGIRAPITFRNMFSWFSINDNFSTDRVDIVRGPNSLLFGVAPAGGLVNTSTKRAQFKNFTELDTRLSSFDGYRVTADINRRLSANVAVRIDLLASTQGAEQRWQEEKRSGAYLTGTWRVLPKTTIRLEGEFLDRPMVRAAPLGRDNYSRWLGDGFVFNSNPAVAMGLQRVAANVTTTNYYIYNGNTGSLADWRGLGQTTGPDANASKVVKDQSILPRDANYGGPDFTQDVRHWTETVTIEQRIGNDLFIELAANEATHRSRQHELFGFGTIRRDPNRTLPNGAPNPNFADYYLDVIRNRTHVGNTIWEARISAIYDLKLARLPWMEHKIFASTNRRREHFYSYNSVERLLNNPTVANYSDAANAVRRRIYFGPGDTRQNTAVGSLINDSATGLRSGFVDVASNAARGTTRGSSIDNSYSISASSSFFGGRLRSLVGQRQDHYTDWADPVAVNTATGIREFRPTVAGNNNLATKPFYGVLVSPVSWFTVYGTKAQSFSPSTGGTTPFGEPIGVVTGKGEELGVRVSTPDGRAYVSVVKYKATTENLRVSVATAVTNINAIWNEPLINAIRPGYTSNQLSGGTDESTIAGSKGYEVEAFTNLTRAWALTLNYSLTDNEQITVPQKTIDYINAHLTEWRQLATSSTAIAAQLNTRLVNLDNFIANQIPGVKGVRNYKHTFNVFTRYRISEGPLRGVTAGLGANYRSAPIQFSEIVAGKINTGYGESRAIYNAMLSYGKKFQRFNWSATLYLNNLLDHDYFDELSLGNTRYGAPRTWSLSNRFTF